MEVETTAKTVKVLLKGSNNEYIISFERKKRLLIGSAETCDVTIVNDTISPIHIVCEYHKGVCTIYDMNSRLGTKINGQATIKKAIKVGDQIELGAAMFQVGNIGSNIEAPPPIMQALNVKPGKKLPSKAPKKTIVSPSTLNKDVEYDLSYPLGKDPAADFTEYIFEDSEQLYPIFNYSINKSAVEVIILHQERILSVDYISDATTQAFMCGISKDCEDIEYPYLAKKSRDLFIEQNETACTIHPLYGHEVGMVGEEGKELKSANSIDLGFDSIVRFVRDDTQIFVRRTDAPPKVAAAPVFEDDPDLRKYLALTLIITCIFIAMTMLFKVDKEIEKEKIPERIATILYKRLPKIKNAAPAKKISKKKTVTKKHIVKKKTKPAKVVGAKKPITKKMRKPAPVVTRKKVQKAPKIAKAKNPTKNRIRKTKSQSAKNSLSRRKMVSKSKGRVDVYKSSSFKSSLSSLMAKGGSTGKFQAKVVTTTSGEIGVRGESAQGAFKKASVTSSVGSLSNATVGKLDQGSGVEGIVNKRTIGRASIPVETIVVGMDPNLIRQTLLQYLDQFRYCYQNALDSSRQSFNGVVVLDFAIAASGRVSRANALAKKGRLTPRVHSCVVNVLRKIPFPTPPGGGTVDVRQPMNFYSKIK